LINVNASEGLVRAYGVQGQFLGLVRVDAARTALPERLFC